ncbi:MAG: glucose-6-phosphate 1-dehydrogenase [Acidimicrobiia bacterium]
MANEARGHGAPGAHAKPDDHVVVLFGATGDLAARKLIPGFFRLHAVGLMPGRARIVGTSPIEMSADDFREHARDAVEQFGSVKPHGRAWDAFIERLDYVVAGPPDLAPLARSVERARDAIGGSPRVLHYLSIPPLVMRDVVTAIGAAGLAGDQARVVLEKPFGTDLDSAKALNALLHSVFAEEQIFRIDHFLGKEDVQNILVIRFANRLFEPVWNAQHVSHVQIDVPETLGVENRAKFYEETGAFRDMVVTHLFQALGFVAMDPPAGFTADALATEKQRVFDALVPLDPSAVVRGQYAGYRALPDVADDSDTETLVAVEARIENERWSGVPIYLRTGKRMPEGRRVITLTLKHAPLHMFPEDVGTRPDQLVFEIGEPGGIRVNFVSKEPGPTMLLGEAHLDFEYARSFHARDELEAYERLLHDAMLGDRTLFNRADGVERLWEVAQPLLASAPPVLPYEPGTWGPPEVDALVAPGSWYLPDGPPAPGI